MEPVSSESQRKTTSPSNISTSESQCHLPSHFTASDISARCSSEQFHHQLQQHQQVLQVQFPRQQEEHLSGDKNVDIQNQQQLHRQQFHEQQFSGKEQQEEQHAHQQEFQAQFQKYKEYQQQQELRGLKQHDHHLQQNEGHVQEQLQQPGEGGHKDQSLQERQQSELDRFQQCELEMFSPVSQHVRHALDLFLKTKESGERLTDKNNSPYTYRSDDQSTVLSQYQSLVGMSLPLVHPHILERLPVPVSVNENSKTKPDHMSSPSARENPPTVSKLSDGDTGNSHNQSCVTKIYKLAKDQHVYHSENTTKEKEMLGDAPTVTKEEISQLSLLSNSTFSQVEKEISNDSSAKSLELNNSKHEEILNEYSSDDTLTETEVDMEEINKDKEKNVKTVENYICLCNDDFLNYAKNKSKKYMCGGCFCRFISICHLHQHLENHGSGGSYHFDHISRIAYPKYDTFCSFTQTDAEHSGRKDEIIHIQDENVISDVRGDEAADTVREIGEQTQSTVPEQKLQPTRKCRKRKQDNPKPTKPRFVNTRKGEKSKTVKRKSDMKQKKDPDYYMAYEDFESYHTQSHTGGLKEAKSKFSLETPSNEEKHFPECTVVKQEVTPDENESQSVIKHLRKRGRPRKFEKTFEKNVAKKRKMMKSDKKGTHNKQVRGEKTENFYQQERLTDINSDLEHEKMISETEVNLEHHSFQKVHSGINVKQKLQKNAMKYQVCDVCGLPVPKYNYVYHMRRHTGEKPFVCDKCGKAFAHRRFLVKHMLIHAEEKPWKCNLCAAQFCQKSEYSMHMNAHEGKRPHECKVCEMKFLSKSMLNTHQANVHMGITRFECDVCHRRFFKRSSLNVHQATHFEATLKCNFCDRMFKDRAGLKRHERIHTGEKRFRCHICNHEFIQSTPYWVHMEKRHQMKRETVKNMLKDIRENNKRVGIRTEINVLPSDVDHLLQSQEECGDASVQVSKNVTRSGSEESSESLRPLNSNHGSGSFQPVLQFEELSMDEDIGVKKLYTDIKVPNIYSSNVPQSAASNMYTSEVDNDTLALRQHYRCGIPERNETLVHPSSCETGSPSSQESVTAGSQSLGLPANLPVPVGLSSMGMSMGSVHHGLIGLNTLQQALDYSNTIPNTGTYTDISSERVNNDSQ